MVFRRVGIVGSRVRLIMRARVCTLAFVRFRVSVLETSRSDWMDKEVEPSFKVASHCGAQRTDQLAILNIRLEKENDRLRGATPCKPM